MEGRGQDTKEVRSPCRKKAAQIGEANLDREELERRESCSERTGMAFPGGGGSSITGVFWQRLGV